MHTARRFHHSTKVSSARLDRWCGAGAGAGAGRLRVRRDYRRCGLGGDGLPRAAERVRDGCDAGEADDIAYPATYLPKERM